ncbi:MAG: hypothetical protein HY684_00125 [Chloroflexi bacterium]|nr:hypothetical protein [Chloroflexota bacterium]
MALLYNPFKVFLPLVALVGLAGIVLLALGIVWGGPWVLLIAVMTLLSSLLLGGLALISDLLSRYVRSTSSREPPSRR